MNNFSQFAAQSVSNFDAARFSMDRGGFHYTTIASDRSVDKYSRTELARKSCWAFDNDGFVRGLINKAAAMCAQIRPKANTKDEEWNTLADAAWKRATQSGEVFDVSGRLSGADLFLAFFHGAFRIGDCGVMLGRTADYQPRISFYEGYSIGDNPEKPDDKWTDGLLLDKHNKAQRYRILTGDGNHTDVDRKDFIFFYDFERAGQNRGLPRTYHMLNHVHDSKDIVSYWKNNVKYSSQVAMQIVNSRKDDGAPAGMGNTVQRTNPNANIPGRDENITYEEVANGSKVLELGDERLELLHDDRPSPNQVDFMDYLKRDMSLGFGLPVEVIWDISKLGGANTRTMLDQTQRWVEDQQDKFIRRAGSRLYNWVIALEMKSGRLPQCSDPNWYSHTWMRGARQSADFAKDGRALLELKDSGEISPDRLQAFFNIDADQEDLATIARYKKRVEQCALAGIPYDLAFSPRPGSAPVTTDDLETLKTKKDEE